MEWVSTISRRVSNDRTLSLSEIVERISRDLELEVGDSDYSVSEVTRGEPGEQTPGLTRDVATSVVAELAAAIGLRVAGR